jgi:mRNA-degrading endonuclease toxin of MazEF toxin-antitoxin module
LQERPTTEKCSGFVPVALLFGASLDAAVFLTNSPREVTWPTRKRWLPCRCPYVPLTTQNRGSQSEVEIGTLAFLNESSIANVQGIGSLPRARLERKLGALSPDTLAKLKQAVAFAVEL